MKGILQWVLNLFRGSRVTHLENVVNFEIKQRKELERKVNNIELEQRRVNFDMKREVGEKIENYEELFQVSKAYGDNLIKVAMKVHNNIEEGKKKE